MWIAGKKRPSLRALCPQSPSDLSSGIGGCLWSVCLRLQRCKVQPMPQTGMPLHMESGFRAVVSCQHVRVACCRVCQSGRPMRRTNRVGGTGSADRCGQSLRTMPAPIQTQRVPQQCQWQCRRHPHRKRVGAIGLLRIHHQAVHGLLDSDGSFGRFTVVVLT